MCARNKSHLLYNKYIETVRQVLIGVQGQTYGGGCNYMPSSISWRRQKTKMASADISSKHAKREYFLVIFFKIRLIQMCREANLIVL